MNIHCTVYRKRKGHSGNSLQTVQNIVVYSKRFHKKQIVCFCCLKKIIFSKVCFLSISRAVDILNKPLLFTPTYRSSIFSIATGGGGNVSADFSFILV